MSWGRKQLVGSPARKAVLLLLCDYAHPETGSCKPDQKYLATHAEMSVRALQSHLAALQSIGKISVTERWSAGGGRLSNVYTILISADSAPMGGSMDAKTVGHGRKELRITKRPNGKGDILDAFEQAWRAYPKRSGGNSKPAAEKAFRARVESGVPAQYLIGATLDYAMFCDATGKWGTEFVMMASTFYGPGLRYDADWSLPGQAKAKAPEQVQDKEESYAGRFV